MTLCTLYANHEREWTTMKTAFNLYIADMIQQPLNAKYIIFNILFSNQH